MNLEIYIELSPLVVARGSSPCPVRSFIRWNLSHLHWISAVTEKKLTEHRTHKPMRQCLRIPSPPMLLKLSPSLTSPLCVPYQFSVSIVCITSRFSTEILFCRLTQKTNKEMTHNALLHFDPFGETQCWSDTSHTPNSFSYPVCCVAIYFDFLSSYLPTMSFGFVAWSGMLCSGDIYNDSGCLIRCDRLSFNR